jgi:hypothetical protein
MPELPLPAVLVALEPLLELPALVGPADVTAELSAPAVGPSAIAIPSSAAQPTTTDDTSTSLALTTPSR